MDWLYGRQECVCLCEQFSQFENSLWAFFVAEIYNEKIVELSSRHVINTDEVLMTYGTAYLAWN